MAAESLIKRRPFCPKERKRRTMGGRTARCEGTFLLARWNILLVAEGSPLGASSCAAARRSFPMLLQAARVARARALPALPRLLAGASASTSALPRLLGASASSSQPLLSLARRGRSTLSMPGVGAGSVAEAVASAVAAPAAQTVDRAVGWWLLVSSGSVFCMVVVGGITRLTRSGLSMTDWRPQGKRWPRNDAEWEAEFDRWKQFPEYQRLYKGSSIPFSMEDFKGIFFWEWFHRMMGRCAPSPSLSRPPHRPRPSLLPHSTAQHRPRTVPSPRPSHGSLPPPSHGSLPPPGTQVHRRHLRRAPRLLLGARPHPAQPRPHPRRPSPRGRIARPSPAGGGGRGTARGGAVTRPRGLAP